jgi:hypothetical protein
MYNGKPHTCEVEAKLAAISTEWVSLRQHEQPFKQLKDSQETCYSIGVYPNLALYLKLLTVWITHIGWDYVSELRPPTDLLSIPHVSDITPWRTMVELCRQGDSDSSTRVLSGISTSVAT